MQKRRTGITALFAVVTAVTLLLGACGSREERINEKNPAAEENAAGKTESRSDDLTEENGTGEVKPEEPFSGGEEAENETQYPVTVTDQLGRQVVIEKEPEKLVSGYYISSSLLIALGQSEKLVGIEAKADTRPIYALAAPQLLKLPSVGTAKEFDLEGCAALEPDLVIVPAKLKESIPAMEELGFTVVAVNPEDWELFAEAAELLGTVTNKKARAAELLADADKYLEQLQTSLEQEEKPSVYLAGNSSLLSTAGGAMYQDELIVHAGGVNVASELSDSYWSEISYEQLIAWNPDYIILAADAEYTVDSILEDEQLKECTAVKNGHVYQIPGNIEAWDSPVPGSVMGSLWLGSVLHPKAYSADEYRQAAVNFYEKYYGFQPEI